jgi:hypothetical protein
MTYTRKRRTPVVRQGLGLFESEDECTAQATSSVKPLVDQTNQLSATWNPTGFYTPDELLEVMTRGMEAVRNAQAAVDQTTREIGVDFDKLNAASQSLFEVGARATDYINAAKQARQQQIRLVNAPGLKAWLIGALQKANDAMVASAFEECRKPWWGIALAGYVEACQAIWGVVASVGGQVLAIGENTLKIGANLTELLSSKWMLLALGGVVVAWHFIGPGAGRTESHGA